MNAQEIKAAPAKTSARRLKSDSAKVARGETRLTVWISPEASAALQKRTAGNPSRGAIQSAVNAALIAGLPCDDS